MGLEQVYQKQLIDHYHNPRNYGEVERPDFYAEIVSPTCGDSVTFSGIVEDGVITKVAFHGEGSVLSQGVASLLSQHVVGMRVNDVLQLDASYIQDMLAIELGPNRLQTAALPLHVLQKGLREYAASKYRTT